ncbi:MAG TPA: hypothetical protein VFZ49_06890 [Pyrinomonadaceae bacterium]
MSRAKITRYLGALSIAGLSVAILSGCGVPPQTNGNTANLNANTNQNSNTFNANVAMNTSTPTFGEPESYQGVMSLNLEAVGEGQQTMTMPPLQAVVARSGNDRAMQFALPNNEKIIYIEKGAQNFVVLPSRKQYAELNEQALGFEVRRLMMPDQIVDRLKGVQGVKYAGEETVNGRTVQKYIYGAAADTGTQAGTVTTESFFLVDKETGLPVRSAISSQSTSGANVQGFQGVRLVTQMNDIKTTPDAGIFDVPTDYQKIDPEQVRAQANTIFNAAAAIIGQLINQANARPSPAANMSPAGNSNTNR